MSRTPNAYIASLLADFYPAQQAWWEAAEYATCLYATELAEYKAAHPMPRLSDFMKARKAERQAAAAEAAREAAELAAREAEWLAYDATLEAESIMAQDEAAELSTPARIVRAVVAPVVAAVRTIARKIISTVRPGVLRDVNTPDNVLSMSTGYETWTITPHADITIGRTTYTVHSQTFANGSSDTYLTGPRGATYLLRRFIEKGGDTGLRQIISLKSGAPLRVRGNEVRVHHIGDLIEIA